MATFLRNLPSFNKDNFSNFQPDNNKYLPKKQSIYACNQTDDPFEQLIVNQRCNLVIQYLEKQAKEPSNIVDSDCGGNKASKVAKKRDIDEVNKYSTKISSDDDDDDDDGENSSKLVKKKRSQIDETMAYRQQILIDSRMTYEMQTGETAGSSTQAAAEVNETDNIIEVDDVNPANNSSTSNNNDDDIDV